MKILRFSISDYHRAAIWLWINQITNYFCDISVGPLRFFYYPLISALWAIWFYDYKKTLRNEIKERERVNVCHVEMIFKDNRNEEYKSMVESLQQKIESAIRVEKK